MNIQMRFIYRFWLKMSSTLTRKRGASSQVNYIFHSYLQILRLLRGMQQYEDIYKFLEKSCSHRTKICHVIVSYTLCLFSFIIFETHCKKFEAHCKNVTEYYNFILVDLARIGGFLRIQWHLYSLIWIIDGLYKHSSLLCKSISRS